MIVMCSRCSNQLVLYNGCHMLMLKRCDGEGDYMWQTYWTAHGPRTLTTQGSV